MAKITKKLNAVFFESTIDTTGWFIFGLLIGLLAMVTIIAVGAGEMIGNALIGAMVMMLNPIVSLLQEWGTVEADSISGLIPAEPSTSTGIAVCVIIVVVIIAGFGFLAYKFPEKMRKIKECAPF